MNRQRLSGAIFGIQNSMKNKLEWFRCLPFWLAFRLLCLSTFRRVFRLPIVFSFSQGAEDIIVPYIARYQLGMNGPGKYVDVGSNSPVLFSNTFALYLDGWRGINIDANQGLVRECQYVRKKDVCVHAAVSDSVREVTFHKAKVDALSTIDETRLVEWKKDFEFSEEDQETLTTRTLTSILDENWEQDDVIDLLTIDVEGHDFQVLRSLDFVRYRPRIIVIETHSFDTVKESEIYTFLTSRGYELKYFAVLNAYFLDALRTEA